MGSAIATVTGLLVVSPDLCQKEAAQEASTGHWKGQYPWPFGRDPNSSVTDVTRSDRLKGNVSVMYITFVP